MRKLMLLLAVFGLVGLAWGADPIIGKWKLNVAKSKFRSGRQVTPKERTDVYREIEGDQIEWTRTEIRTDGSSGSEKLIWPQKGGAVKWQFAPQGESLVETLIEPGNWYVTRMRNGKQISVYHKTISNDGKTLSIIVKGSDEQGKPYESLTVYDKQ